MVWLLLSYLFTHVDLASIGKTLILQVLRSLRGKKKTILVMEVICYIYVYMETVYFVCRKSSKFKKEQGFLS